MNTLIWVGAILILGLFWGLYYCFLVRKDKGDIKKLLKNYDVKEDLSKQGEIRDGSFFEGRSEYGNLTSRKPVPQEPNKLGGREVLPTADVVSVRKNSKCSRGILRKLRR